MSPEQTQPKKRPDEPCEPVAEQFGTPLDQELLSPDFAELHQDVVDQGVLPRFMHAARSRVEEIASGEAAQAAKRYLGCVGCRLSGECVVEKVLETRIQIGEKVEKVKAVTDMLSSAPKWLSLARLKMLTQEDTLGSSENVGGLLTSMGAENPYSLLAGVENEPIEPILAKDLPELDHVDSFKGNEATIPGVRLKIHDEQDDETAKTGDGREFDIYDATEVVGFKGEPLTDENYAILCKKLLERIVQRNGQEGTDGDRVGLIATPDGTNAKGATRLGG